MFTPTNLSFSSSISWMSKFMYLSNSWIKRKMWTRLAVWNLLRCETQVRDVIIFKRTQVVLIKNTERFEIYERKKYTMEWSSQKDNWLTHRTGWRCGYCNYNANKKADNGFFAQRFFGWVIKRNCKDTDSNSRQGPFNTP